MSRARCRHFSKQQSHSKLCKTRSPANHQTDERINKSNLRSSETENLAFCVSSFPFRSERVERAVFELLLSDRIHYNPTPRAERRFEVTFECPISWGTRRTLLLLSLHSGIHLIVKVSFSRFALKDDDMTYFHYRCLLFTFSIREYSSLHSLETALCCVFWFCALHAFQRFSVEEPLLLW